MVLDAGCARLRTGSPSRIRRMLDCKKVSCGAFGRGVERPRDGPERPEGSRPPRRRMSPPVRPAPRDAARVRQNDNVFRGLAGAGAGHRFPPRTVCGDKGKRLPRRRTLEGRPGNRRAARSGAPQSPEKNMTSRSADTDRRCDDVNSCLRRRPAAIRVAGRVARLAERRARRELRVVAPTELGGEVRRKPPAAPPPCPWTLRQRRNSIGRNRRDS